MPVSKPFLPARHVSGRRATNRRSRLTIAALSCGALSLASFGAAAAISGTGAPTVGSATQSAPAEPAAGASLAGSVSRADRSGAAAKPASRPAAVRRPVVKPADQPEKGLVYRGLKPATGGACLGGFEVDGVSGLCTHGPDAAPPGFDPAVPVSPATLTRAAVVVAGRELPDEQTVASEVAAGASAGIAAAAGTTVPCFGDGSTGNRVQVLYVHGSTDRFATFLESFRTWAVGIDEIYDASAVETGGRRHVRFLTEPVAGGCRPTITSVAITDPALPDFSASIKAIRAQGFSRSDRKYVMFTDSPRYCGIAGFADDDIKGAGNRSNFGPSYGRSDNGCWAPSIAAHELGHNLGAVSNTAPNTSGGGHCVDEYDVMCYSDGPNFPTMQIKCADRAHDDRLDCNHDDYYSTNPPAGSYLAGHFNVADNVYLVAGAGGGADGQPPTVPAGLTAGTITATSVQLSWTAATDNVGVAGYDAFRNGVAAGSSGGTSITVGGLTPATAYTFTVKARDAAGNVSAASAGLTVSTGSGGGRPVAGRTYALVNAAAGTVADVVRASTLIDAKLTHAQDTGATSQRWTAVAGPAGALSWKNQASGMCMAVQGASTVEGTVLVQRTCTGGRGQLFKVVDPGIGGGYQLVNVNSAMALGFGADRVDGWRVLAQRRAALPWLSLIWTFRAV